MNAQRTPGKPTFEALLFRLAFIAWGVCALALAAAVTALIGTGRKTP